MDRVDAGEDHRELARAVQALDDLLRAEVAQVEQDVAVDAAALVDLGLLRARDDVAGGELHRVRRVVLQEALALGVEQVGALAAAALRDQHARRRERRRVELHHLHVLQRHAERAAPSSSRRRCRSRRSSCPSRAGRRRPCEDHRLRADRLQAAVQQVPADHALAAAVVDRRASRRSTPRRRGCRASSPARRAPGRGRGR